MTPKPRTPGDGGDNNGSDGTPGSPSGGVNPAGGVKSAQDAAADAITRGEPGGGGAGGSQTPPPSSTPSTHTAPSGQPDPNATPGGTPTDTSTGSPKQREGHRIENDTATILARAGYRISQNTGEKGANGTSDPDYNLEGKLWDCYAPSSDNRNSIRSELRDKVKKQSGSIVINMERSPMTVEEMKAILPHVKGLGEVKIIDRDGTIIDAFPQ